MSKRKTAPPPALETGQIALLRRLLREEGLKHWRGYAIALSCMGGVALATGLTAYIMKDVINEIFIAKRQDAVLWIGAAVVLLFAGKGFASYGQETTMSR